MGLGKVAHKVGYLITYSSVVCQSLFLGFGVFRQSWRIVKSVMLNFCSTGKIRAIFRRVSAERNDQIKIDGRQIQETFGEVRGNHYPLFRHSLYGQVVHFTGRSRPRRVNLQLWPQLPRPAFGHLTATGITRAEEKNCLHDDSVDKVYYLLFGNIAIYMPL